MNIYLNYILLDGACLRQHLNEAKNLNSNYSSLYKGRSEEDLAGVAPYLFAMQENKEFENWYKENGWGHAWGLLVQTQFSFENIHRHFRKFLLVKTEEGKELYFRFYDPRVLRIFLPTCDIKQLKDFFGPVEYFICEDEDPVYGLIFSLENNNLNSKRLSKAEIFNNNPLQKNLIKFYT